MASDPHWDTAILDSHAPRVGTGEPRVRQQLAVWKERQPRPRLTALDRIFWVVLSRAWKSWRSSLHMVRPENGGGVAPAGVQALLGAEESTPKRSSRDGDGDPRSDSAAEPRQPALGSAEDPWRAAEVRADGIAGDGLKGHAPVAEAAITGVANVFKESRQGSHRLDFFTVPTATTTTRRREHGMNFRTLRGTATPSWARPSPWRPRRLGFLP